MNRFVSHTIENAVAAITGLLQESRLPSSYKPLIPGSGEEDPVDFYAIHDTPQILFDSHALKSTPQPGVTPEHRGGEPGSDRNRRLRFHFPSEIITPFPTNNTVYGMADLRPSGMRRGALVVLHGHRMPTFVPLEWRVKQAARNGWDIYYLTLPYHMRRRPPGTYHGQYIASADLGRTLLAFRQAVVDVRGLVAWLKAQSELPVALAGFSLGAYVAALTALVEPRISALVLIMGGASWAQATWEAPTFRYVKRDLGRAGVGIADLEDAWRLIAPGRWQPCLPTSSILLVAGQHDNTITPANVQTLWRAWGRPELRWFPCGHTSMLVYSRQVAEALAGFIDEGKVEEPMVNG